MGVISILSKGIKNGAKIVSTGSTVINIVNTVKPGAIKIPEGISNSPGAKSIIATIMSNVTGIKMPNFDSLLSDATGKIPNMQNLLNSQMKSIKIPNDISIPDIPDIPDISNYSNVPDMPSGVSMPSIEIPKINMPNIDISKEINVNNLLN